MSAADKLARFAEKKSKPAEPDEWIMPSRSDLPARGNLFTFDQSLGNCAVLILDIGNHRLKVMDRIVLHGRTDAVGHEGSLQKTVDLYEQLDAWLGERVLQGDRYVHEAPPTAGGKMMRPESSLLASAAVRLATRAHEMQMLPMADPRAHAKLMTGDANASKEDRRKALPEVAANLDVLGMEKVTNADLRDSLSVGIYTFIKHREEFD